MPVHKAYAKIANVPATARLVFTFMDDNTTITGIDAVDAASSNVNNGVYYNLNGQRVEKPQHGLYIYNGKKIMIK